MGRVTCSDQVEQFLSYLPAAFRESIEQRFDYLEELPRMYALTDDERFPGCRSFWVDPSYRVFYMVAAGADDVHVVALIEEEVADAHEG